MFLGGQEGKVCRSVSSCQEICKSVSVVFFQGHVGPQVAACCLMPSCPEAGQLKKGSDQNQPRLQGAPPPRWKSSEQVQRKVVSMAAITRRSARKAVWDLADWRREVSISVHAAAPAVSKSPPASQSKAFQHNGYTGVRRSHACQVSSSVTSGTFLHLKASVLHSIKWT